MKNALLLKRLLVLLLALASAVVFFAPTAKADLQQCPYPGVSHQISGGVVLNLGVGGPLSLGNGNANAGIGVAIGGNGYYCIYPRELNGSNWWCDINSAQVIIVNGQEEKCTWRCPDGRRAEQPNPPFGWMKYIAKFKVCKPLDPDEPPMVPPPEAPPPVDMTPPLTGN